jgi:hypothetical protein
MSGTERLPASRVVLLDRHIRVSETDDLGLSASLHIDGRLLGSAGGTERFVDGNFTAFVVCHIS